MYQYIDTEGQHLHTLDGRPLFGTSTICKEVMPPFLAKWGAQCAVDFIRERLKEGTVDDPVLEKAVFAYSKVRDAAADKGTDMHAELEKYVQHCIEAGGEPEPLIDPAHAAVERFSLWAQENIQKFVLSEKNVYSRGLWVGGIIDCVAHMKSGELAIVDFKSSKEAYFNQVAQVAGYALQFEENGGLSPEGSLLIPAQKIDALIIVPFGGTFLHPEKFQNVDGFKDVFRNMVSIYSLLKAFKER